MSPRRCSPIRSTRACPFKTSRQARRALGRHRWRRGVSSLRAQTSPNSRRAHSGQKNASRGGSSFSGSSERYPRHPSAVALLTRGHSAHARTCVSPVPVRSASTNWIIACHASRHHCSKAWDDGSEGEGVGAVGLPQENHRAPTPSRGGLRTGSRKAPHERAE
jgi:hypothetical protein